MLSDERHNYICELVNENGAVTSAELVERFGVSAETIRRDLLMLEKRQLLQRVHGGAVKIGGMERFHVLSYRMKQNDDKKHELARFATKFIEDGDIIAVDAGSTAVAFAEALSRKNVKATVVTHSLDIFEILSGHKNFEVILCGGRFLNEERAFYGEIAIETMKRLHVKKAFLFVSAVSFKFGICDYHYELYQIQKQILEIADEVFVLADSTKLEKNALLKLDDMLARYTYITDSSIGENLKELYRENNLNIICSEG